MIVGWRCAPVLGLLNTPSYFWSELIRIDQNWSELIRIDQNWKFLKFLVLSHFELFQNNSQNALFKISSGRSAGHGVMSPDVKKLFDMVFVIPLVFSRCRSINSDQFWSTQINSDQFWSILIKNLKIRDLRISSWSSSRGWSGNQFIESHEVPGPSYPLRNTILQILGAKSISGGSQPQKLN